MCGLSQKLFDLLGFGFVFLKDRVHSLAQAEPELTEIHLPRFPECRNYKCELVSLASRGIFAVHAGTKLCGWILSDIFEM